MHQVTAANFVKILTELDLTISSASCSSRKNSIVEHAECHSKRDQSVKYSVSIVKACKSGANIRRTWPEPVRRPSAWEEEEKATY